ncbi:MAG TPA: DUF2207 domain-containing protein, partial [Vicinamibacterales bacterium]|nr:DUF2207 domain-containing protein [Vicinamibacterales bacterium]
VEIVGAALDGRPLPFGTGSGEVEVKPGAKVRVRWRFAPRSDSTHTFTLNYIVRGVVRKEDGAAGGDVLEWIALPTEHAYRIDTSTITIDTPAAPHALPAIESRRVGAISTEPGREHVQVIAAQIAKNGWVKARLTFADGSLISAAPSWQHRQIAARALAGRWITAGLVVLGVGLVFLVALRQRYDSPPRDLYLAREHTHDTPPDALRPALAGAVAANGSVTLQHAMAALFSLADRGIISIVEEPRRWGQRQYTVRRNHGAGPIAPEEAVLLALAFRGSDVDEAPLAKVRQRVAGKIREFKKAVLQELRTQGLLHDERARIRGRYLGWSFALLVLAVALAAGAGALLRDYGPWPLIIAGAVAAVSILGFIFHGALTPLSNDGVRRAEEWRAYQRHLRDVARDRRPLVDRASQLLPFAVALGLAGAWSRFVKQHPSEVPAWFRTMAARDDGAFPAFIAIGGSGDAGGGGAHGAGGAAGGGASGAG